MVYRKFRESKQWGKINTRLFRKYVKKKHLERMPKFVIPPALEEMGVEIHDPNAPGFFEEKIHFEPNHPMFRKLKDEVRLYSIDLNNILGSPAVQGCQSVFVRGEPIVCGWS
jgi:hypothetical protein